MFQNLLVRVKSVEKKLIISLYHTTCLKSNLDQALKENVTTENICSSPTTGAIEDYLIDNRWKQLLKSEFKKPYFKEINRALQIDYADKTIFPPKELVFNAFNVTKFSKVSLKLNL